MLLLCLTVGRIENNDFGALACALQKVVRLGFDLAFGQFRLDIFGNIFQLRNEAARLLAAQAREPNIAIVIFHLLLRHDCEGAKAKVQILFYRHALAHNLHARWAHILGLGLGVKTPLGGTLSIDYGWLLNPPDFLIPQATGDPATFRPKHGQINFRFTRAF